MAKQLTPNIVESPAGTTNPKHNTANRNKIMTNALSETYNLDAEIKVAQDKYVKPLRDAKRDIKARLREDLNMTATVFNSRYVPYKVEALAIDAGDEATLDNLRELFEIAPVGTQMDFLSKDGEAASAGA